ncbi:D-malate degradation protein R [Thalassovita gelatinovora]|uniref:D-malate degradation protein R n=1 Tax=Thalassovita gelatinovora TaxID=53501 RepID=A0A0P1FAT6_THAGE|nr:LysR family transcriptional regulator [Thalassovita gelatinovora]QIZ80677.1 LysR family transcriptional regulator [Thalassovita gelatinovora]CUH65247.1 D-malate degradation protein R [Thalassovita gelatinovora]SEQ88218.1 DNA-binding transcriptional regulator, LysR family [Thalassovita gelatinovora]
MTDRLETMSIFVRVVDEGSLTAGARALRMPIATVSRRISELEDKLRAELLLRSPRGLTLTDTGRTYVAACRRILEEVSEAERNASGEFIAPRGTLTMTAPIVFGRLHVLPTVNAFLRAYPDVDVQIELTDRTMNLHEEHLDLAVRIGPLADSAFIARKVGEVRQIVCASPSYLGEHGTPKVPSDLAKLDGITFQNLMSPQNWRFGSGRHEITVPVRSRLIVNAAEAAIDAAIDGLGFTRVLSYQAAAAIRAGRLVPLLQDFEPEPWPVHLLYEPRALIPQKLRAFLDFAAPRIADGMPQPYSAAARRVP